MYLLKAGSHPLLAQIPLTVSPFISLPTATTLPYTYKTLPSTLPPSSTGNTTSDEKAKYVVSSAGHSAHPEDIIASCKALQSYLRKVQEDADRDLKLWDEAAKARELAEKRRVAPGWLDSDARILEPAKKEQEEKGKKAEGSLMDMDASSADSPNLKDVPARVGTGVGDELDRAFGGLGIEQ